MNRTWTTSEAIELCCLIESIAPQYGCHVALTGGLLYKGGERKDCDIVLYRIRQFKEINLDGLFEELAKHGIAQLSGFGFCYKAEYRRKPVDFLVPEEQVEGDGYVSIEEEEAMREADRKREAVLNFN